MGASKRGLLAAFAVLGGLLAGMLTPAAAYATGKLLKSKKNATRTHAEIT